MSPKPSLFRVTKETRALEAQLKELGDEISGECYGAPPIDLKKLGPLGAMTSTDKTKLVYALVEIINRLGRRIEAQDAKIASVERLARTGGKRG